VLTKSVKMNAGSRKRKQLITDRSGGITALVFSKGETVYSTQEFRADGWIFLRWLAGDPQPPGDLFSIHFWFLSHEKGREPNVGDHYIVFIAPAKTQGIFVSEMMLLATEDRVSEVRRAVRGAKL